MDIKLLPAGVRCLVDANILIYHLGGLSPECKAFIARVTRREVEAYLTTVIVAEVLHRRMMLEAVAKNLITPGQSLKKLKANSTLIASLTDYIAEVEDLLRLPFTVIEVTPPDISRSHSLRHTEYLFVNDSLNLACAERHAIADVVTHDGDFARVTGIATWEPTDV